jgi:hypothetical protein
MTIWKSRWRWEYNVAMLTGFNWFRTEFRAVLIVFIVESQLTIPPRSHDLNKINKRWVYISKIQ